MLVPKKKLKLSSAEDFFSEDRLQQECFLWLWNNYPKYRGLLFHVPNGGTRNSREAAKLKTMGLIPGVSDFVFLSKGKAYFIELKRPDGKNSQSAVQEVWQEKVESEGFSYAVIRTLDEFKELVLKII